MTPIALLGWSDSATEFRIHATMLSAFGRTRLAAEHEVKPLGQPFDGLNTVLGNLDDIGSDGQVESDHLVGNLIADTHYHWRVRARYDLAKTPFQGNGPWIHVPLKGWNEADLRTHSVRTSIETAETTKTPGALWLLDAPRPNPSRSSAEIRYALPQSGRVRVSIYDVTGREVVVLVDDVQAAGPHIVSWDGRPGHGWDVRAGIYFVHLEFAGRVKTRKVIVAP